MYYKFFSSFHLCDKYKNKTKKKHDNIPNITFCEAARPMLEFITASSD